jgi:hypothetical protein
LIFTQAHVSEDTVFLNRCFTNDERIYPPNSEAISGKMAISQVYTDWVNYGIHIYTETSTRFYGNADYLVDKGTYRLIFGDDLSVGSGKYMNIWKMEMGEWRKHSNIWNSDLP